MHNPTASLGFRLPTAKANRVADGLHGSECRTPFSFALKRHTRQVKRLGADHPQLSRCTRDSEQSPNSKVAGTAPLPYLIATVAASFGTKGTEAKNGLPLRCSTNPGGEPEVLRSSGVMWGDPWMIRSGPQYRLLFFPSEPSSDGEQSNRIIT